MPNPYRKLVGPEILTYEYDPLELMIDPWLPKAGLAMLAGFRGKGKTFFSLTTALAIASGGEVLCWHAPMPHTVLYVDGEMNPGEVQMRIAAIWRGMSPEPLTSNFRYTSYANQEGREFKDLALPSGRRRIEDTFEEEVLILDNLSSLFRRPRGSNNDEESWLDMQDWLHHLRGLGKTVLFVHHTGKPSPDRESGSQRGTSKREDILDTVILLGGRQHNRKGFTLVADKTRGFEPWPKLETQVVWDKPYEVNPCRLVEIQKEVGLIAESRYLGQTAKGEG